MGIKWRTRSVRKLQDPDGCRTYWPDTYGGCRAGRITPLYIKDRHITRFGNIQKVPEFPVSPSLWICAVCTRSMSRATLSYKTCSISFKSVLEQVRYRESLARGGCLRADVSCLHCRGNFALRSISAHRYSRFAYSDHRFVHGVGIRSAFLMTNPPAFCSDRNARDCQFAYY